jgi:V8-like Glu-specific endopeptidase
LDADFLNNPFHTAYRESRMPVSRAARRRPSRFRRPGAGVNRTVTARTTLVVCVVSGVMVFGLPQAASSPGAEPAIVAHRFGTDPVAVRSYWTPTLMRGTIPLPLSTPPPSDRTGFRFPPGVESVTIEPTLPTAAVGDISPQPTSSATRFAAPVSYRRSEVPDPSAYPYRTAGKIFGVSADGSVYDCSATSVSSQNNSVIWTAAHCIYDSNSGGWSRALQFVPGYKKGSAPYGEWPVVGARLSPVWTQTENPTFDMAALVVAANPAGRYLGDVVGGRGFLAGQPREQSFDVFGYPSASPFDGERLHVCESTYGGDDPLLSDAMAIGCDMTTGSSGGGWIIGDRYLNSVISYGYASRPEILYGPYFGATAGELHRSASTAPVPRRPPSSIPAIVGGKQHHAVRISLRLSGHLQATGKLRAADGYLPCTRRAPVTILRSEGNSWRAAGRTRTGDAGSYRVQLPDVPGTYKAFSPSGSVDNFNKCTDATSGRRRQP